MKYQVCYHYNNDPTDIWYAKFFDDKKLAVQFYEGKKDCCLYESVKILTIGGK